MLAYQRLQVGMQQHVSIGVDGKVVAVWSELQRKKESCRSENLVQIIHWLAASCERACVCVCLQWSGAWASWCPPGRRQWPSLLGWAGSGTSWRRLSEKTRRSGFILRGEQRPKREKPGQSQSRLESCVRAAMSHRGGISKAFARSESQRRRPRILQAWHINSSWSI